MVVSKEANRNSTRPIVQQWKVQNCPFDMTTVGKLMAPRNACSVLLQR